MFVHMEDGGDMHCWIEAGGVAALVCQKCGKTWTVAGHPEPAPSMYSPRVGAQAVALLRQQQPDWFGEKK